MHNYYGSHQLQSMMSTLYLVLKYSPIFTTIEINKKKALPTKQDHVYSTPKRTLNEPNTSYTGNGKIAFEPRGDQNEPNSSACARTTTTTCRAASRRVKQRTPPPKYIIISLGGIATAGRQMCAYYARPTTQPHHAQHRVHGMKQ